MYIETESLFSDYFEYQAAAKPACRQAAATMPLKLDLRMRSLSLKYDFSENDNNIEERSETMPLDL